MSSFKVYTREAALEVGDFFEMRDAFFSHRDLALVHAKSPAHWAFPDPDEKATASQSVGLASHLAILNSPDFDKKYIRGLSPDDYPGALMTDAAMKSFLKARGVPGYSAKKGQELVEMVKRTGESIICYSEVEREFAEKNNGKEILKAKDYDRIVTMQKAVLANYGNELGGFCGITIMGNIEIDGNLYPVVISPDLMTKEGAMWDYVTTTSAHPDDFGKNCLNYHRLIKAALEHDVFEQTYGQPPQKYVFLAQEKTYPHVAQAYQITEAQLEYGREKYREALVKLHKCNKSGLFPAYGQGIIDLTMPAWTGIDD